MIFRLNLPVMFLSGLIFLLSKDSCSAENTFSVQSIFSIQVASFPDTSTDRALKLYGDFKKENRIVYLSYVLINQQNWNRVRVGVFKTREEAAQYREARLLKDFPDAMVIADSLYLCNFSGKQLICTHQDLWIQNDSLYQALDTFSSAKPVNIHPGFENLGFSFNPQTSRLFYTDTQTIRMMIIGDVLDEFTFQSVEQVGRKNLKPAEIILPRLHVDHDTLCYQIAVYDSGFHKIISIRDEKLVLTSSVEQSESTKNQKSEPSALKTIPDSSRKSVDIEKETKKKKEEVKSKNPLEEFLM